MGTAVNGTGIGMPSKNSGMTLSIKNTSSTNTRMKPGSMTAGRKKNLNYNYKEISSQLLRASKARNANMVLTRAKGKLYTLRQCLGTGQYNDSEVRAAIAHASRMVKCAQLKVRNLKEEEQVKKKNDKEQTSREQQRKNEVRRRVRQKEQALKTKAALEETSRVVKEKAERQDLARRRRMHRNEEREKISEADLKYLQEKSGNRSGCASNDSGVMMELSMQAMELSGLQLSEHALELLEEQAEREIDLEMGSIEGMDMAAAVTDTSAGTDGGAAAVSECASVDIVV